MDQDTQSLHTEGTVADYFAIEGHIISTRSADCYKAVDRSRNESVSLWMLRHPLALESEAVKRFLSRMRALADITPTVSEMTAYGVDSGGTAFSVFPAFDGHPINSGNLESAESERRFTAALRYIDRIHQNGIACGDICGSSFWVNRAGDVRLVGVMGTFDSEAVATAMLPPIDTIPFFAPEQRSGGGIEIASDVFSLGVLGYYLLARSYPFGEGQALLVSQFDLAKVLPISAQIPSPPVWADEVLRGCLNPNPDNRYHNAGEILAAIADVRQRVFKQESSPVKIKRDLIKGAEAGPQIRVPPQVEAQAEEEVSKLSRNVTRIIAVSIAITVVIFALYLSRRGGGAKPEANTKSQDMDSHVAALGSDELKKAAHDISSSNSKDKLSQLEAQFDKIANSDDPLAHEILVKSAKEAESSEVRVLAEKAIVDRARRLGLLRSAEQVKQWLRAVKQNQLPPAYEPILKSLDTTLPIEARSAALRQAYASEPQIILRLAIAIGLDSDKLGDYQPVISQLVGDDMKLEDSGKYSSIGLVLADPNLAIVFGEDVIQKRDQIPDSDLLWVLKVLADRNDINVRSIASLAVERGILPPIRAQFLQMIRDRADLPPDVVRSLLRAAAGALKPEDIGSFGRWYDLQAEKVLLAVCADVNDPDTLLEAFDTLAGRTLTVQPSAGLVTWVRKHYWDKRANFAKAVGVLGNLDRVTPKDVEDLFGSLDQFARDSDLVDLLLLTDNAVVVRTVISKYADLINLNGLLKLLGNSDKAIRIEAIKGLKRYNDIGALKIIIDHYEKEQDQDVKQVYKDTFWMIKQRQEAADSSDAAQPPPAAPK